MKTWQKILIPTLISLSIAGIYLFIVWRQRQNPGAAGQAEPAQALTRDDVAVVRPLSPQHFADLQQLVGTRVWMKNGYVIPYYPFENNRVEFTKRVGLVPATQPMDVKKFVKAVVPTTEDDGMGHGSKQVFAVFALPGRSGPGQPGLYATPVGSVDGKDEAYYTDLLLYYDDPHGVYSYWPKDTWAAVDAHQVKPGMSELETRMAIGQKMHPDGSTEGDRTVTYDQDGKQWTVTYVKNRATVIKSS